MIRDLLLKEYCPDVALKLKRTKIEKPRFPVIDAHNHMRGIQDVDALVKNLDESGISKIVNLDGNIKGGWEDELRDNIERFETRHPNRVITFGNINVSEIDSTQFRKRVKEFIRNGVKYGMKGLKFFKDLGLSIKDSSGKLIMPDDERLRIIWETAAEESIPVLYHIADPVPFFWPIDGKNEKYDELAKRPQWSFHGPDFPSRESLIAAQRNLIEKNPNTLFILPHIACNPEDMDYVSTLLDTYGNFVVDISARLNELGRQPYTSRKFFIRHQDRILFGLDGAVNSRSYINYYRFLETDDEYFDFRFPEDNLKSRWKVYGIYLPDDILKKVYYDNAARIIKI